MKFKLVGRSDVGKGVRLTQDIEVADDDIPPVGGFKFLAPDRPHILLVHPEGVGPLALFVRQPHSYTPVRDPFGELVGDMPVVLDPEDTEIGQG